MTKLFQIIFLLLLNIATLFGQEEQELVITDSISARLVYDSAAALIESGQFLLGIPLVEQSLAYYEQQNKLADVLESHYFLSFCYRQLSEWEKGIHAGKNGLALIAFETTDKELIGTKIQLLDNLGTIYLRMGNYKDALIYYEKGLIESSKSFGESSEVTGRSIMSMGLFHLNTGGFEEAENYFQQSSTIHQDLGTAQTPNAANVYVNLATAQLYLNNYKKALENIDKSIPIYLKEFGENYYILANSYQLKGLIFLSWKENNAALDYFLKAINISRKSYGENSVFTLLLEKDIGSIYQEEGDYSAALSAFQNSLHILEKNESLGAIFYKAVYGSLGIAYTGLGNYEEALVYQLKALAIIETDSTFTDFEKGKTLYNIGLIYEEQDKTPLALNYIWNSQQTISKVSEQHPHLKKNFYRLTEIYLEQQKLDSALLCVEKGIQLICPIPSKDTKYELPTCNGDYSSSTDINTEIQLLDRRVQILQKLWQKEPQDIALLKTAMATCQWGVGFLINRNKLYDFSLNNSTGFDLLNLTKSGFRISELLYEQTQEESYLQNALEFAELGKGIQLEEAINMAKIKSFAGIPDSLLEREKDLKRAKTLYAAHLQTALEEEDSINIIHFRDEKLFLTNRLLEGIQKEMKEISPKYAATQTNWLTTIKKKELQNTLAENTLFVEYIFPHTEAQEQEIAIICIDKKGGMNIYSVPMIADLESIIKSFNQVLQSVYLTRKDKQKQFIQQSHELYQQFVQPIEHQLIGKDKIVVIGEEITNYLPFEVLIKSNKIAPFKDLAYLIKEVEVSYHYSGKLWLDNQIERTTSYSGDLLAFAPVFSDESKANAKPVVSRSTTTTAFRAYDKNGDFIPLYHTQKEVETIEKMFKGNGNKDTKVLLFEQANEENLKEQLEKDYQYIHIASHSFSNIDAPDFSGIACYQNESDTLQKEDELLYVGEVYNLDISADLVVLSSCESGFGQIVAGEGMMGLNRSFVYAGVPNVLFSLWKVNDKSSSEFMIDFYKNRLDGQSYGAALRATKLKLIQESSTASPNIWSSFLLMGQ